MIADDVVETIGRLADRFGASDVSQILIGLGLAPDELKRFSQVAAWSVDRVERSLVLLAVEGLLNDDPGMLAALMQVPVASWLDGFAVGLAVGRSEDDRRPSVDDRPAS